MRRDLWMSLVALLLLPAAIAQTPEPLKVGGVTLSGSWRTRVESWDWFQGNGDNTYTYPGSILRLGLSGSGQKLDWQVEFALPLLIGLPGDAVAPGAQGQLGFGASYFAANNRSTSAAMLFAKLGFLRIQDLGGVPGQSLKLGRTDFVDGGEVAPKDATLAALKRDRVAQRLLGNVGFSHAGRSYDGVQYALNRRSVNFTLFAARPTRGVYQVDGWGELNANVFYAALTGQAGKRNAAEWRVFGLGYSDYRDGVVKTDNRPLPVRSTDADHIHIGTYGGHYLQAVRSSAGSFDFLLWGALQNGSWGALAQRSGAFAAEAGWQPAILPRVRPWIRAGYNYGSGDRNPADGTHGTFFQVLLTPRTYARFPFFNMMNTRDTFGELILRPAKALSLRTDVHGLRLANSSDLWYTGCGMFQPWTFGFAGRPSAGHTGLATLFDVSADYSVSAHTAIGAYLGHAAAKSVVQSIYPTARHANFAYVELLFRL